MKSIYVGNMPYSATEDQIRELFGEFGAVHAVKIIFDREKQRPKGFCFVEMDDNDALKAIEKLNDTDFLGRNIKVNESKGRV